MRKCVLAACAVFFIFGAQGSARAQESHLLFTRLLKDYVRDGRVDYKGLSQDKRLDVYLKQLSETEPDKLPSAKDKLAFWINVYNAYTLKLIRDNYPLKSINTLHRGGLVIASLLKNTAWDQGFVIAGGKKMTLNEVEHKILRPMFKEPRIHFAIVCAAKGCPPLRSEAYEAARLDSQLNEQGRVFLSQAGKNSFDLKNKTAHISPIFGWFRKDFGKDRKSVLLFIAEFLEPGTAEAIRQNAGNWRISYTYYDWSLNE